jgi:hypothetical protein
MCDPLSLASGFTDLTGGLSEAIAARGAADVTMMQIETAAIFAKADSTDAAAEIDRQFAEIARANLAGMAMSGLGPGSFASIVSGNRTRRQDALSANTRAYDRQKLDMDSRRVMAGIQGRMTATAAMLSGVSGAAFTGMKAYRDYQKNHMAGQSIKDYFFSFGRPKKET